MNDKKEIDDYKIKLEIDDIMEKVDDIMKRVEEVYPPGDTESDEEKRAPKAAW